MIAIQLEQAMREIVAHEIAALRHAIADVTQMLRAKIDECDRLDQQFDLLEATARDAREP